MVSRKLIAILFATNMFFAQELCSQPVITDSRIKTFVYNENDVYNILTHHGYQAHITLARNERIRTISVGDKIAWQVIPDGHRVFIRSLVAKAHTNMTVITDKRSYQFDLQSTSGGKLPIKEELVYAVKFYYPDQHIVKARTKVLPPVYADQLRAAVAPPQQSSQQQPPPLPPINFDYSFTGNPSLAPERIFDDGKSTYFKFTQPATVYAVSQDGRDILMQTRRTSDGYERLDVVTGRYTIRYQNGEHICIYNEQVVGGAV